MPQIILHFSIMPSRPIDPESQLDDRVTILGAWAIAPILFEDPEFKALYDREYDGRLRQSEASREIDMRRDRLRSAIDEVLQGRVVLGENGPKLPVFEEESLNSREEMGKFLLELIKKDADMSMKYLELILECGTKLSSQPPQKKGKKSRWGVEIPASLK